MRSAFSIGLVVFVLVACGSWGIMWYAQAKIARQQVEKAIESYNEQKKLLSYEAIETSGFPFKVNVSLIKPHLAASNLDILMSLFKLDKEVAEKQITTPWIIDGTLNGDLTFGINMFSNRIEMTSKGSSDVIMTIADKEYVVHTESEGIDHCVLEMRKATGIFDTMWDMKALWSSFDHFTNEVRSFECTRAATHATDPITQVKFSNSGPIRLYMSSEPTDTMNDINVSISFKDLVIHPDGNAPLTALLMTSRGVNSEIPLSDYGTQNMELDFTYNAPKAFGGWPLKDNVNITLNKFDITNQLYEAHWNFAFTNMMADKLQKSRVYLKLLTKSSEQYDNYLYKIIRSSVDDFYAAEKELKAASAHDESALRVSPIGNWSYLTERYTADQLFDIIKPAIPKLAPLGQLNQTIDVSYEGEPGLMSGNSTLSAFELSAAPYGITGKAAAKLVPEAPPAVTGEFTCNDCLTMLDDLTAYADRVGTVLEATKEVKPQQPQVHTADVLRGIRNFLAQLGQPAPDAGKNVLRYTITNDATGNSVNGKPMAEVMMLYMNSMQAAAPLEAK